MSAWCVLLAAGKGERAQLNENKVFFRWQGRSVLSRCVDALSAADAYDGIVLVLSPADMPRYEELLRREGAQPLVKKVISGGATRRESGYNGLRAVPTGTTLVSVHDAARPFVTAEIIRATLADAAKYGSGVISTPVTDTIKRVDPDTGRVTTLERGELRAVQTPQSFDYKLLMEAHMRANAEGFSATDDAVVFERVHGSVHLSTAPGAERNVKLTLPQDFAALHKSVQGAGVSSKEGTVMPLAEMSEHREQSQISDVGQPDLGAGGLALAPARFVIPRMGTGYDAHRLVEGRRLVLCGVDVPHERGLDGHSDADVAVHALMDAILGALGEGDIGQHFPDRDPRYRGISSMLLLAQVMDIVRKRGCRIGNVDVTIVAQKPKLAPYIERMRQNLATALGVSLECASVKATTTERMGFEGEEIGISAQAVALLFQMDDRREPTWLRPRDRAALNGSDGSEGRKCQ